MPWEAASPLAADSLPLRAPSPALPDPSPVPGSRSGAGSGAGAAPEGAGRSGRNWGRAGPGSAHAWGSRAAATMAERIEQRLEDRIPELEQLERVGLFTPKEIRWGRGPA